MSAATADDTARSTAAARAVPQAAAPQQQPPAPPPSLPPAPQAPPPPSLPPGLGMPHGSLGMPPGLATSTAAAPDQPVATVAASEAEWSTDQQKRLEVALRTFPASAGAERWDRIAEQVPGKTKAECVRRYKEIAAALKASKAPAGKQTAPPVAVS